MNARPETRSFVHAALTGEGDQREATGYDTYIKVRLTLAQKAEIERIADQAGITVSAYVRSCIRIAPRSKER